MRVDPFLEAGEPVVAFNVEGKTRLKIGDGKHCYKDLEFIDSAETQEILTYPSYFEFPVPPQGNAINAIFRAVNEAALYQWNQNKYKYEPLNTVDVEITLEDIDAISGGEASDLFVG